VSDLLGSRFTVSDPLDRDDVSASVCLGQAVPDRGRLRIGPQRGV
jgi:hypothetical protein